MVKHDYTACSQLTNWRGQTTKQNLHLVVKWDGVVSMHKLHVVEIAVSTRLWY